MKVHVIYGSIILLLIGVAGFLLYVSLDTGVSLTYRDQQVDELEEARRQLMDALPYLVKDSSKSEVVATFERVSGDSAFEKDGCTWIGRIGLKFDPEGQLLHVSPSWSYGGPDPCFPTGAESGF